MARRSNQVRRALSGEEGECLMLGDKETWFLEASWLVAVPISVAITALVVYLTSGWI